MGNVCVGQCHEEQTAKEQAETLTKQSQDGSRFTVKFEIQADDVDPERKIV